MQYTRLELRLLPRGWSRGTLYTGPVGGKVRGALVDPTTRVITHTLAMKSRRHPPDVEAFRAVGDERTPVLAGQVQIVAGMRVRAGTTAVGHITTLWADRVSGALTHVLVRPQGGILSRAPARIVPVELAVSLSAEGFQLSKGTPPLHELPIFRPDEAIARDVRLALAEAIPEIQARRSIKTRVDDGHVSLVGTVETKEIVEMARRAVEHVSGVRGVTLDVIPLETLADRVEQQIARVIAEQRIVGATVRVLTEHAIVYLEGCAPTMEARAQIERAALAAAGVRVVVNDIAVGGETPSRATQTGPLVRNR